MGRKGREMIGWLSLGLNSSGSEELQHWNDMRAARQPTQVQRWHSLLRPWNIWSRKSFCYKTTFHVNDNDMVWSMEHGTNYGYSCTPWYMTDRVAKQLNFSRWMRLRSIGCRLYCPNRTKKSIYWSVDPVNQSCHNLACGNSEFKTLSMYQVHSFLIRWTELRVFPTYILRMYITYTNKERTRVLITIHTLTRIYLHIRTIHFNYTRIQICKHIFHRSQKSNVYITRWTAKLTSIRYVPEPTLIVYFLLCAFHPF